MLQTFKNGQNSIVLRVKLLDSSKTDGSGLRRLTRFYEDLPMIAFSPDGTQAAIMGLGGIYRANPDAGNLRRVDLQGDHGGLDWAR